MILLCGGNTEWERRPVLNGLMFRLSHHIFDGKHFCKMRMDTL